MDYNITSLVHIPESPCNTSIDVGFLLDSSGSLALEYGIEKDFLKLLAAAFGVSKDGSRAGVITFSYHVELSIKLHDHTNITSFWAAVNEIQFMSSKTFIDKALHLADTDLFTESNGGRPGVAKLIVLLTDGTQTKEAGYENPAHIAERLRKEGINILVVGIGTNTSEKELANIAGGADNVFNKTSFAGLLETQFIKDIREASCNVGK